MLLPRPCLDPGREELAVEYFQQGEEVLSLKLESGGELIVTRHAASEQDLPDSRQEWRVLAFRPEGSYGPEGALHQSVVKVSVTERSSTGTRIRQRADVLIQKYARSLVSVVLSTLEVLGRPVVSAATGETLKILCVGLGAGSVSSFLVNALPHCEVDAIELEPAVVEAATRALGLETGPRHRVLVEDGAAFALHAAGTVRYDALIIDAFDAAGNTPACLWTGDGGICKALAKGLLSKEGGLVAVNFLESVDVPERLASYREALKSHGAGIGFSVRTMDFGYRVVGQAADGSDLYEFFPVEEGAGNYIAVQTCGPRLKLSTLREKLQVAGAAVTCTTGCKFDMAELAVRGIKEA